MATLNEKTKMFLFARWISMIYADEHLDDNMKYQGDPDFNPKEGMSVLNRESGNWWLEQLNHFNDVVFPNYIKNGSFEDTKDFIKKNKE